MTSIETFETFKFASKKRWYIYSSICFPSSPILRKLLCFYFEAKAKPPALFLIFAHFTCSTSSGAGGRDPEWGEGWERSAVFTPLPPHLQPSPSAGCRLGLQQHFNWSHPWKDPFMALNDHPSLLRGMRQETHASSALSFSVGKLSC